MRQLTGDQVGVGWRPELAAGILSHLDEIDVVEVLLEDHLEASSKTIGALAFLGRQVPVIYHGVTLGLASAHPVDRKRLDRIARTIELLKVERWSEHLAFVRAGGTEIGHLAAPPRTLATAEGACRNLRRIYDSIGIMPALENIATLVEPPCSTLGEAEWIGAIAAEAGAELLVDLHNLLCNARNTGLDPERHLLSIPLERATCVHLSGGRSIQEPARYARHDGATRLLDDHLNAVPPGVFALLTVLASRTPRPLTVIIERDGNYPPFCDLLSEVRSARAALARGRSLLRKAAVHECA
jgi:uncharacterized protein